MAFTEDLSEFLDSQDGFSVAAVLDGQAVDVIFDNEFVQDEGISGTVPVAKCKTADASSVTEGTSTIVINSITYLVEVVRPDGTGMSDLVLAIQP